MKILPTHSISRIASSNPKASGEKDPSLDFGSDKAKISTIFSRSGLQCVQHLTFRIEKITTHRTLGQFSYSRTTRIR